MKNILLVVVVLVVGCLGFIATRPNRYHVERSITVSAAPAAVYSRVNDFHQWMAWSPWEHLDPNMVRTIGGAESGVGATYHWSGNDKAGEGNMEIIESTPDQRVAIRLDFIKPFQSSNTTAFALAAEGEGTRVTWTMDGNLNYMEKAMCLFMSMDKVIGGDFEKGLASIKSLAEAAPAAAAAADSSASGAGK